MSHNDSNVELNEIKDNMSDHAAMIVRLGGTAASGLAAFLTQNVAVGLVGPVLFELLASRIPNQKQERIANLAIALERKLEGVDPAVLDEMAQDARFGDLVEDGLYQAARALTPDRLEYIASLIKNSITQTDVDYARSKWLLYLLGQLNDIEVVLLKSEALSPFEEEAFYRIHEDIVVGPQAHIGSSQEEVDKQVVHNSYRDHMVQLGLLRNRYRMPGRDGKLELDENTGTLKRQGRDITPLGRLLLDYIDLKGSIKSIYGHGD